MTFAENALTQGRPESIRSDVSHYPSPAGWRDEVLYFLLVDRFSDGRDWPVQSAGGRVSPSAGLYNRQVISSQIAQAIYGELD